MTHTEANGLTMSWTPVTDENGRIRMEARWMLVDETATEHGHHSQAA